MDAQVERRQPLITARLVFAPKAFPPPPTITAWMEFPCFSIPHHREQSLTPEIQIPRKCASTPKRQTTPRRASTPQRGATPSRKQRPSVAFENNMDDSGATPERGSTPKRHTTPQRGATPMVTHRPRSSSVAFENDTRAESPLSSLSEDDELDSDSDEVIKKILKPAGEAGRPQSGGYNLQEKLGWNNQTYDSIVALVHKMAKTKLNTAKSFRGQDTKSIKQICDMVRKEYAILNDYEKDWPTRDMLKLHLKYTSEASRRSMTAATAKQIEKIATRASSKAT